MLSAPFNSRSENVRILPVIVAELKLRDVQRYVLAADLVEASHDPALEDRPETFNRVRVDRADHVTMCRVPYLLVRIVGQAVIDTAFVGSQAG